MTTPERKRSTDPGRAVRAYAAGLRLPPADLGSEVEAVVARARRGSGRPPTTLRGRFVPLIAALAAALVLLVVVAGPAGWGPTPTVPADSDRPSLPDRTARYSYLTGSVSASPPGRAIAMYHHGTGSNTFDFPQVVVLGADRDVYRRLDAAEDRRQPVFELSPDGTLVAVGSIKPTGDLAVVDLATGDVRLLATSAGTVVTPLSWSPDGRSLVALEIPYQSRLNGVLSGQLLLFDVAGGGAGRPLAGLDTVTMAAYAPDGAAIAIQDRSGLSIVGADGRFLRRLDLPDAAVLASGTAWSPDGDVLAIWGPGEQTTFVDPTGAGRRVPGAVPRPGFVHGWTAPGRIVLSGVTGAGEFGLIEVDLAAGTERLLTMFDSGPGNNYGFNHISLATGLLAGIEVRPAGSPARGPWPVGFQVCSGIVALLVALVVRATVRRRRRRRRELARVGAA